MLCSCKGPPHQKQRQKKDTCGLQTNLPRIVFVLTGSLRILVRNARRHTKMKNYASSRRQASFWRVSKISSQSETNQKLDSQKLDFKPTKPNLQGFPKKISHAHACVVCTSRARGPLASEKGDVFGFRLSNVQERARSIFRTWPNRASHPTFKRNGQSTVSAFLCVCVCICVYIYIYMYTE